MLFPPNVLFAVLRLSVRLVIHRRRGDRPRPAHGAGGGFATIAGGVGPSEEGRDGETVNGGHGGIDHLLHFCGVLCIQGGHVGSVCMSSEGTLVVT